MVGGIGKGVGRVVGELILRPLVISKIEELKGQSILIHGAENLETYPNQPLIIALNHIGPTNLIGKAKNPDSGFTPDVLIASLVIKMLTKRKPYLIAGVNDEAFSNKEMISRFKNVFINFSSGLLYPLNALPVDKMTIDRNNSDYMNRIVQKLQKNNIIYTFAEGIWRDRDYSYIEMGTSVKAGTGIMSKRSNTQILPVYIDCATSWSELDLSKVSIGNLISPDLSLDEIRHEISNQLIELQQATLSTNSSI